MDRFLCIHGHFYQPPRENPWLEAIEWQESAHPYHDWNERIAAECYAPNARARILDGERRIVRIANNYARISFNFGPTLLSWMEQNAPAAYAEILAADGSSRERFAGHGSALAQPYNHMILPLANTRDRFTQVRWGLRDFERRFGRKPEGMWLPETAVDLQTLDVLAQLEVAFTILSPYQARRFRKIGAPDWQDCDGGRIDPSRAYRVGLPSGRQIVVFFYDGPISHAVAFEGLLHSGEHFARRLVDGFSDARDGAQLVHIATDGESYGHHHRFGEMALARALDYVESNQLAQLANYGAFLAAHPPDHEAEIIENTACSCAHGVGRWSDNCGCHSGDHPGWNQAWRAPLRAAFDWLRDALGPRFEAAARELLKDPWAARDDYIDVVLDRSDDALARYLRAHARRKLSPGETTRVLRLMELQRHAMLMYTSCAWFFDELSGIETVQVIRYAARAVQLARTLFGDDLEAGLLERLQQAPSNIPEIRDGRRLYETRIQPAIVDLPRVAAHYAFSALFEEYPEQAQVYSYGVQREAQHRSDSGKMSYLVGRAAFSSRITRETTHLSYAVLYLGDHTLTGGVREFQGTEAYEHLIREGQKLFRRADIPELIRFLEKMFQAKVYSPRSLFRDEQRRVVLRILERQRNEVASQLRRIYEENVGLLRFLAELSLPMPRELLAAVNFVLNSDLLRVFEAPEPELERAAQLLAEARGWPGFEMDLTALAFALRAALQRAADAARAAPAELDALQRWERLAAFVRSAELPVDLARAQDAYDEMRRAVRPGMAERAAHEDVAAKAWCSHFDSLGEKLWFRIA